MTIKTKFVLILALLVTTLVAVGLSAKSFLLINERSLETLRDQKLKALMMGRDQEVYFEVYLKDIEVVISTREPQILVDSEPLLDKVNKALKESGTLLGTDNSTSVQKIENFKKLTESFVEIVLTGDPLSGSAQELARRLNTEKMQIQNDLSARRSAIEKDFDQTLKDIHHYNEITATTFPVAVGALSVVVIALSALILRSMFNRIEMLRRHFARADLDSLQPVDVTNMRDELGALGDATNRMLKGFRESRQQLVDKKFVDNIIETLTEMLMVTDGEGRLIRQNQKAINDLELSEENLRHFNIFEAMSMRDASSGYNNVNDLREALMRGASVSAEVTLTTGSGKNVPLLISGAKMDSPANGGMRIVISARDMTDMIRAQDEKTEMQKQLTHAARLASLGTLGAGVAHELNNPLVGVRGYAELIRGDQAASDGTRTFAEKILQATERMRKIIDHLRTFSTNTSSRERIAIDINDTLNDSLILLRNQLAVENIKVELDLTPDLPAVLADSNQLESVFQNLIVNAKDALGDLSENREKTVTIRSTRGPGQSVHIQIADNASGIPEHLRKNVWDPFFTTKDVGKGTGLGLSIVHSIVKDHKGTIDFKTSGQGTTFFISFPCTSIKAEKAARKTTVDDRSETIHYESTAAKPRCVIIDDEEMVADVLAMYIHPHYELTVFHDSKKAVTSFDTAKYDLIITDMKMPGLSGLDVLKLARQKQPNAPVVIISGHAHTDREVEEAKQLGASLVIAKPFPGRDKIVELLAQVMSSRQAAEDPRTQSKRAQLLIIDDELGVLEVMKMFLEGPFDVTITADAAEAHSLINSGRFDLIITDMHMPQTSGKEILHLAQNTSPGAKVMVMSGSSRADPECIALLRMGAIDILTKPFVSRESLLETIAKTVDEDIRAAS